MPECCPMDWPHTYQAGCFEMDTNWQQETWLAKNHLALVMVNSVRNNMIVQSKDKCRGTVAALRPKENEKD